MGTSRKVLWALIVSVCCLSSMLAVTALSDPPPDPPPTATFSPPPPSTVSAYPPTPPVGNPYTRRVIYPSVGRTYSTISSDPKKVTVTLKDGSLLLGEIVGMEHLMIETEYGKLRIPLKQVDRIGRHGPTPKTTVGTHRGDQLTGRLDVATLKLKALWGDVSLDTQHVVCMKRGGPVPCRHEVPYSGPLVPAPRGPAPTWSPADPALNPPSASTWDGAIVPMPSYGSPESTPSPVEQENTPSSYTAPTTVPPAMLTPPPPAWDPYTRPPRYYPPTSASHSPVSQGPKKTSVRLTDGSVLRGDLVDMEQLNIETEYGDFSVPATMVRIIKWSGMPGKATVGLCGGDRLTGRLDISTLKLKALWGEVSLDMKHVLHVKRGEQAPYTTPYSQPPSEYPPPTPVGRPVIIPGPASPSADNISRPRYIRPEATPSAVEAENTPNSNAVPMMR